MRIKIFGTGCRKCIMLENNVKQAVAQIGGFRQVEKVEDIVKIMEYSILSTPGLVIDDTLISSGKSYSVGQLIAMLKG